jgi:Mn2+/Fe2+ NRAMP family transporter
MFVFYSSGAIEDGWDRGDLGANRAVAVAGMAFGSVISMAVLVGAALVLGPKGIMVDDYQDAAQMLVAPFGEWGFYLFVASLIVACAGAALEVSLTNAYSFAQGFGWNWGESLKPAQAARFSTVYTATIALSALTLLSGVDPLRLTLFAMALAALVLPLFVVPFLVLMNDEKYMGEHRNGKLSNAVVLFTIFLSALLAVVAIPLELIGTL